MSVLKLSKLLLRVVYWAIHEFVLLCSPSLLCLRICWQSTSSIMQCNKRHRERLRSPARVEIARESISHNVSFQSNSGLTHIKQSEPTAACRASFECLSGSSSSHHLSKRLGRINDFHEVNGCVLRQC